MTKVEHHPSAIVWRLAVADRYRAFRDLRDEARDAMWLGQLATFTPEELLVLREMDFLCPHEEDLLRRIQR